MSQGRAWHQWLQPLWKNGWFNALVLLGILLTALLEPQSGEALRFSRDAIDQGAWWLLFTCHWVHLGWEHTLLNGAGLLLITLSFQWELAPKTDIPAFLVCSLGTGLGMYLWSPDIHWYVGLSGVLHGYLLHYLIQGFRLQPGLALVVTLIVIGKIIWEQSPWADTTATEAMIGGRIAVDAHMFGGITGFCYGLFAYIFFKPAQQQSAEHDHNPT